MTTDGPTLPPLLLQLAAADEDAYKAVVLRSLLRPDPLMTEALRHPSMRRRTLGTLKGLLVEADRHTRKDADPGTRGRWQQIRFAARQERDKIHALPPPFDETDTPRRRALQRLAAEYPEDWARLFLAGRGRPVSLRHLVQLHHSRFRDLLNDELRREAP